ncbi:MAG: polyprenyl synthetase family protein [Deltaproteobacteria bacterium]|nr:polyprenyl synthetase family protein [Deltaproteobacteria bacterium]MBN2673089.1 polyprenyl synthetase family protein [Deltaproteobacteria bacterium]
MSKSLSVLKQISDEQGLDSATAEAIDSVSLLLDEGLAKIEDALFDSTRQAPKPVSEIADYILDAGGKRIRPALCMLGAKAFSSASEPIVLATVCELLHNATLLHDDVIDEGDVRRGKPASRMVWSNALSILGGDYMLMRCVDYIAQMDAVYTQRFVETLKALIEGEIIQLRFRETVNTTQDDYFEIVNGKTSSLFSFATTTGAMFGGGDEKNVGYFGKFGHHIGISFQLIDDVLDFDSDSVELGKNLLADISQGKMTLPVILAAEKDPAVVELLEQLKAGEQTNRYASEIAVKVASTGALEATRTAAAEHTRLSIDALNGVSASNSAVISVLEQLSLSLLHRTR